MPKEAAGFLLLLIFHLSLPLAASELSETLNDTAQVIEEAFKNTAGRVAGGVSVGAGTAGDIRQEAQTSQTASSQTGTKPAKGTTGCRDSLGDLFRGR